MTYDFEIPLQVTVYGQIEAHSKELAKEELLNRLRLHSNLEASGDKPKDDDICTDWEVKEKCRGNVCNFCAAGIELFEVTEERRNAE